MAKHSEEVHEKCLKRGIILALDMLQHDPKQSEFVDFYLPFSGRLKASNRWVKLASLMPWDEVERCYAESLAGTGMGAPAKSGRIAYGALVIKERLGITDAETAEQIGENPYLQYFLGLEEFRDGAVFDSSMMVHFRERFSEAHHRRINEKLIEESTGSEPSTEDDDNDGEPPANSGKLLVDASCTPADIKYPTDLGLLNEAREKTESIIDRMHGELRKEEPKRKKPRTYRQKARKQYLSVAKQKKPGRKKIRRALGQQLRYVRRNLGHIDRMLDLKPELLRLLPRYDYKCLLVIRTLYQQQMQMYTRGSHQVPDRIVSISQPHVRPIVRGKAGQSVEFGAKISISHQKDGYVSLDKVSWDAYNESGDLPAQIEGYRKRFGHYPASVHADTIYRTRENRHYCKERGIRLSGKPLGRPKKVTLENQDQLKAEKLRQRQDEIDRIPVEGKFGNGKRKGSLGQIMAKLAHTSESVIHVAVLVLNLEKRLRLLIFWLLKQAYALPERRLALHITPIWVGVKQISTIKANLCKVA
jgi:hypothetical protein